MLNLLKIRNVALIESLDIEFGLGLNLLTGETGSGKSIIVDSLGALTGGRVSADLIKGGAESAQIEGLFSLANVPATAELLESTGIEADIDDVAECAIIIRREISRSGKNRIFVNSRLVTAAFLKQLGSRLVDIHGQGEQASLFDPASHLELLDEYARAGHLRTEVAALHKAWIAIKAELAETQRGESEKLQMLDILRFQADEIRKADLKPGEEAALEDEKRRANNIEKLSALSRDAVDLLYDADGSALENLEKAAGKIRELSEFDPRLAAYKDGLDTAQAVLQDLAFAVRDFSTHLEFSPERLEEIETRLAEITRVSRKYGGTSASALEHLQNAEEKLDEIENAEFHQEEIRKRLAAGFRAYLDSAGKLHALRVKAGPGFAKEVRAALAAVALEKAKFEISIEGPEDLRNAEKDAQDTAAGGYTANGFDRVEFLFSANAGESAKPLSRVASGGESSRLMLILRTSAKERQNTKTMVFDEIDAGIGGRVAEAVGVKLKTLADGRQVLCVTHQAQVASKADAHFVVQKSMSKNRTSITVRELSKTERVEEIARMLAGEKITDAARENARELIAAAG